jgi:hypothetical protein
VLVDDESVAVIAVEAVSGGKPHETPSILQDVDHGVLREAIGRGEMGEREVSRSSRAAVRLESRSGMGFEGRGK